VFEHIYKRVINVKLIEATPSCTDARCSWTIGLLLFKFVSRSEPSFQRNKDVCVVIGEFRSRRGQFHHHPAFCLAVRPAGRSRSPDFTSRNESRRRNVKMRIGGGGGGSERRGGKGSVTTDDVTTYVASRHGWARTTPKLCQLPGRVGSLNLDTPLSCCRSLVISLLCLCGFPPI
jgi:hypothetical protein